jgi:hypothetical protein
MKAAGSTGWAGPSATRRRRKSATAGKRMPGYFAVLFAQFPEVAEPQLDRGIAEAPRHRG